MQQTILDHFLPFHPAKKPKKNFFWKNGKNYSEDIIILNKCTKSHDHMLQCFWHTTCDRCVFYFSFWAKNQNFLKMKKKKKKTLKILSFYTCAPKIMITWCMVPEIWCKMDWLTDGRIDSRKKWHIEVGAPPKNTTERMFSFKYTKNELHHKYFPRFCVDNYLSYTICRKFNNRIHFNYFTELLATALI